VLLVPSFQEAYGLVAQEAQSCGVPVIVFNNTGCEDIVSDRVTGLVVTKRVSSEIVNALSYLQNSTEEEKSKMKINARQRANTLWNYDLIARKYEVKYQEIISNSQNKSLR
jgi:glycosyltransferase involved in cell wall biosynthesis